jgi:DNA-binding NtrC family response regulator
MGPSGVGKGLYASYVHAQSLRASKAFVTLNCANLSAEMIETEVFGHARGAFTGAVTEHQGIVSAAQGGTLFLDEIDALPMACQAKILRFAQLREYRRLGETRTRIADVRLISASNADLLGLVRSGAFREDLYFRLRVVPVHVPPLADRPDDIPALIDCFQAKYATEYDLAPIAISAAAMRRLNAYHWPGNVRELENCIRYLTCLGLNRPVQPADLQLIDEGVHPTPANIDEGADDLAKLTEVPLKEAKSMVVEGFEKMYIDTALRDANGNVAKAARTSGKHRRAFFELMRRYGIKACGYRRSS